MAGRHSALNSEWRSSMIRSMVRSMIDQFYASDGRSITESSYRENKEGLRTRRLELAIHK